MNNFTFLNPTKILFGRDATDLLGEEMKDRGQTILLVYGGGSIKKTGLYDRVLRQLRGKTVIELSGVEPNPRLSSVHEGIRLCREHKVDFILAVGGGSAIDCAKAIAVGTPYHGEVWDFFKRIAYPDSALPVGTILTLSATGTEMNGNAVITNTETTEKIGFSGILLQYPAFSILDPVNTFTVPPIQTAYGTVDMLSHVMENYFSYPDDTPIQDGLAETIMKVMFEKVFVALKDPTDYDARANLMWCGTMALNGIIPVGKEGDWGCHAIEHVLSAHYDIAHGAGLAIIHPPYMKYLCQFNPKKYARFAVNVLGIDPAGRPDYEVGLEGIARTKTLFKQMGAPISLAEVGIGPEKLELMAEQMVAMRPLGNYSRIGKEELLQILKEAL
ncbi:MAG: iron-containing alcohol dehydrogenase [Anaerolineaceae bacterium]|nr:iron-containing alcohol dehydrogenase [Anaerolineaceae bacterium]